MWRTLQRAAANFSSPSGVWPFDVGQTIVFCGLFGERSSPFGGLKLAVRRAEARRSTLKTVVKK
jgi:hypothetical protein